MIAFVIMSWMKNLALNAEPIGQPRATAPSLRPHRVHLTRQHPIFVFLACARLGASEGSK